MKKKDYQLIFLLTLFMLLPGSEVALAQEEETPGATQRWLSDTLVERSAMRTGYPEEGYNATIKVESVNFDGCYVTINLCLKRQAA